MSYKYFTYSLLAASLFTSTIKTKPISSAGEEETPSLSPRSTSPVVDVPSNPHVSTAFAKHVATQQQKKSKS